MVVNDRWGTNDHCKNGGYFTCHDRYHPSKHVHRFVHTCSDTFENVFITHLHVSVGTLQKFKWEDAFTIQKSSWGYERNTNLSGYHTTNELVDDLVSVVRCVVQFNVI